MAASADQNPPVVVNLAVSAVNDSRVADVGALLELATDYLNSAGYAVNQTVFPSVGSAATGGVLDTPGLPLIGKALVWLGSTVLRSMRQRIRRLLDENLPSIFVRLTVDPDRGRYDAPSHNTFGGILAILPDLDAHMRDKGPNRRYFYELEAPASFDVRVQRAMLKGEDLKVTNMLKLVRASTKPENPAGTFFQFGTYFPHILEAYPPQPPISIRFPTGRA